MSIRVLKYWSSRLDEGQIFHNKKNFELPHATLKGDSERWPHAVNTVVLYDDFLAWYHDTYIAPLSVDYASPKPEHVRLFYGILKEPLNIRAFSNPRMRKVNVPRRFEGTTFLERRYQRFILLEPINLMQARYDALMFEGVHCIMAKDKVGSV